MSPSHQALVKCGYAPLSRTGDPTCTFHWGLCWLLCSNQMQTPHPPPFHESHPVMSRCMESELGIASVIRNPHLPKRVPKSNPQVLPSPERCQPPPTCSTPARPALQLTGSPFSALRAPLHSVPSYWVRTSSLQLQNCLFKSQKLEIAPMSPTRRSGLSPTWGNTTPHEKDGRLVRQQSRTRWAPPSFLEGV